MPSNRGNKREYFSGAVGRLDKAHKSRSPQKSKNVPVGSNSSKRGVTIHGMFTPSGRPSSPCAQFGSLAPESDR
jgi:hypothetical protein